MIMFFLEIKDVAAANSVGNNISWSVEILTQNLDNQQLVADQMLSEIPTELYYEKLTVSRKRTLINGTWSFH